MVEKSDAALPVEPQQPLPYAEIDWERTTDLCSDVGCPSCGNHFHHCTRKEGSAQHVRCACCEGVIRLAECVELTTAEIDYRKERPPHALVQWKGTHVFMTVHCVCGAQFPVEKDFAYTVDCPDCGARFNTDWYILLTQLTEDEASKVGFIHEGGSSEHELWDEDLEEDIDDSVSIICTVSRQPESPLARSFREPISIPIIAPRVRCIESPDSPVILVLFE